MSTWFLLVMWTFEFSTTPYLSFELFQDKSYCEEKLESLKKIIKLDGKCIFLENINYKKT